MTFAKLNKVQNTFSCLHLSYTKDNKGVFWYLVPLPEELFFFLRHWVEIFLADKVWNIADFFFVKSVLDEFVFERRIDDNNLFCFFVKRDYVFLKDSEKEFWKTDTSF